MSKKQAVESTVEETTIEDIDNAESADLGGLDFNVNDEYKPEPLIPNGTYHGVVTKVDFKPATASIVWSICLHDNGGFLSDKETALDGTYAYYVNNLPRKGDENELTPKTKMTKRQWKINALAEFAETLGIDMSTPQVILTSIDEALWIGIEVDVDVKIEEYKGRVSSKVQLGGIRKSTMF